MNEITDATNLLNTVVLPGLKAIDAKLLAAKQQLDILLANQNDPAAEQGLKDALQAVSDETQQMATDASALVPDAPPAPSA